MAKVQMNVSVDKELKTDGSARLKKMGYSMSEFVEICLKALLGGGNGVRPPGST
jgi:antitoxin component of RelBE/YafQ-DinJ toxin-antitoxin module